MAKELYEMTVEGIRRYQEELESRKTVIAAEISERLKEARALGDLSENSEYDDAKNAQAENEVRIMEIEAILKNAKVIDEEEISKSKVSLGSQVRLLDLETKEEMDFTLVSAKEEDIFNNRISSDSPVGAGILGKKKGQTIDVKTPAGILKYKIVKIDRPS